MKKNTYNHAVHVFLQFSKGFLDTDKGMDIAFKIQDIFEHVIKEDRVGMFDGNEFCEDTVTFFIYGKDADAIYKSILPVVLYLPELPGSYIHMRYGDGPESQKKLIMLFEKYEKKE